MKDKEFFNSIADKWDTICSHPTEKVNYIMDKIQLKTGEAVLDIGSGTGVAIPYLLDRVGGSGKITALDIAEKMIELSRQKNNYPNINFVVEDFYNYNSLQKYDCILAYSCYPHFNDKQLFFKKAKTLLNEGGKIVVAHVESRQTINNRHKEIEGDIKSDTLSAVEDTAKIMENEGVKIVYTEDNCNYYICIGSV